MDPVTLAAVSIGATVASGAVNAFGTAMSGSAQAKQYEYQAGIARLNSQISKQNADYARQVGEVQAQQSGMKSRFQQGKIVTAQSASGLDVNKGSPKAVQDSQHELGVYDQNVIRSNAAKRAYGFEVEAFNATAQGKVYDMAADRTKTATAIGVTGSILGTASSVSSKWLDASRLGLFGGGDTGGGIGEALGMAG